MTQYLPIIIASGLLAFLATPLTRLLARRLGMVDQPGLRKAHRLPVPLLGGLAIYLAVAVAFLFLGPREWYAEGAAILGGITLMFATGLWDDRFGLPPRVKLVAQLAAAIWLAATGVQVQLLGVEWLNVAVTLVWVVGITNALNLMDNMDGLAAGVAAVAGGFFFLLAALEGQGLVASLAAALVGAAAGFLFYNFAPATTFMGDAGSMVLGFTLAVLGIKLRFVDRPLASTWMAPILVLGLPIFDTALVTFSRLRRGRSPFQGGSDHTSHRLTQLGLGHTRAVLTMYVIAAGLGLTAAFLTRAPALTASLVFAILVVVGLAGVAAFERVEPRLTGDPPLVLIPGEAGLAAALDAALAASRDIVVILAPCRVGGQVRPSRAEVVEALALLAEDPAAVRQVLERGLSETWWRELPALNRALRLSGQVLAVSAACLEAETAPPAEADPDVAAALRRARLILLGPGAPESNILPALGIPWLREALAASPAARLLAYEAEQLEAVRSRLAAEAVPVPAGGLRESMQSRLLRQAAGEAKSGAGHRKG